MPPKNFNTIFCYTEIWYLVKYEDDEKLRVLAEDEIHHIFPDEEEGNEMQIGDIISALANTMMPRFLQKEVYKFC